MKLAAVLHFDGQDPDVDALLRQAAGELKRRGFRLAGAVLAEQGPRQSSPWARMFEDLGTGLRIQAAELNNSSAIDCRLDSSALEEAAGLAIGSLGLDVDLVIINRFGRQEADGHGFRPLIELAAVMNIPVLTGLNEALLSEWASFTAGEATMLDGDLRSIVKWCETVAGRQSCSIAG